MPINVTVANWGKISLQVPIYDNNSSIYISSFKKVPKFTYYIGCHGLYLFASHKKLKIEFFNMIS